MVALDSDFKPLLIGQQVRLHRVRALHDRIGGFGHLGRQLADLLGVFDQLAEGLPVFVEQRGSLLETLHDLFIGRRNRLQRVFNEFETRQRAGRNRHIGIDDEGVGERQRGLILRGHLLGAKLDRRKLRFGSVAGEIVKLVAQRGATAGQLVLGQQRALVLDLENVGKDLGKGTEFPGKTRNLVEARRIRGAFHRLIDGVFQAGFRGQRRFGVVFFSGHHIISRQPTVRGQVAIDIPRQIGFRHAVAVRRNARGDTLEAEIGDAHADGRDGEHHAKAEHDFGAKSKSRNPQR